MRKRILLLLIIPLYSCEQSDKKAFKNLSNKKSSVSETQRQLIFENAKTFPDNTQISFAFIKKGKVNFYGIKKENDSISQCNNHNYIFEIGSITKVFTSNLLASFIINNKVKLNDNINDYLNIPFKNNVKITFKSLANHTSGVPELPTNLDLEKINTANPFQKYNEIDLENYLEKYLFIEDTIKDKYLYSNLGAGLLGYTLSKIENVSYNELLKRHIFSKYKMFNTTLNLNQSSKMLVKGLDTQGNEVPNWEFSVLAGAGGIKSNVKDLAKYGIAQLDTLNKELELTRQKTIEVNDNMNIGLGWHIIKSKSNNKLYWHNGGTGGYTASMSIDTKSKIGVIILSNVSAYSPISGNIDKLCFELIETLK